eukprot:3576508-Pyramimonas_sp.AAC.1
MLKAFHDYIGRTRAKLRSIRSGSKGWWKLSRDLMCKVSKEVSPPLRTPDGPWAIQAADKANEFARSFEAKWQSPVLIPTAFSLLPPPSSPSLGLPPL